MQFQDNNLLPFLYTFLPALVYAVLIFVSFPKKTLSLKTSFLHFLMGSITVTATMAFQWIFPGWKAPMAEGFVMMTLMSAFIQVALLEESVKLLFYRFTEMYRGKLPGPLSIMFYAMCISAGFAVVENMYYVWKYGDQVLGVRAVSAIVMHMISGLMMGYFLGLGMLKKRRSIARLGFRLLGLFAAVFLHGLYDFNIMVSYVEYYTTHGIYVVETGMGGINNWWILGPGLATSLLMFLHLRWLRGKRRAALPSEK